MALTILGVETRLVPTRQGRIVVEDLIGAVDAHTRVLTISSVEYLWEPGVSMLPVRPSPGFPSLITWAGRAFWTRWISRGFPWNLSPMLGDSRRAAPIRTSRRAS